MEPAIYLPKYCPRSTFADLDNVWNYPHYPLGTVEEFQHKNQILDRYCAEIGRVPTKISHSLQFIIDPQTDPGESCQIFRDFASAGATHFVLAPRSWHEGIAHWLAQEIIEPVREAVGDHT